MGSAKRPKPKGFGKKDSLIGDPNLTRVSSYKRLRMLRTMVSTPTLKNLLTSLRRKTRLKSILH